MEAEWLKKLELLRAIDSVVDFSRASVQLRILMVINERAVNIDELVQLTGFRRKSILDAVRKLELKGLIRREGECIVLTESGKAMYRALKEILMGTSPDRVPIDKISVKSFLYDASVDLLSFVYMIEVLKILGSRKDHTMSLSKLAARLGASMHTLDSHLQRFTGGEFHLFNRIKVSDSNEVLYTLTEVGVELYRKVVGEHRGKAVHCLLKKLKSILKRLFST